MKIENHLLVGNNIKLVTSPNHSGKFDNSLPDTIIMHYTAGSSAKSSVRTLTSPNVKASAHLVIGRDGSITQLVPFDTIAWHAGKSSHGDRIGFNKYSIGIELDNPGPLKKQGNEYVAWFGRKYPESDVIYATHRNETKPRYWHDYSYEQLNAVRTICELLIDTYDIKSILGHEEISPKRKSDPGPAFPLDKFRDKLLDANRDHDEEEEEIIGNHGIITASSLNIRSAPDGEAEKIAQPLPSNTQVKIMEATDGWLKVEAVIEGWVSAKYVKKE